MTSKIEKLRWVIALVVLSPIAVASAIVMLLTSVVSGIFTNERVQYVCYNIIGFILITVGQVYARGVIKIKG